MYKAYDLETRACLVIVQVQRRKMFELCQHAVPLQVQSGFILDCSLQTCSRNCQT